MHPDDGRVVSNFIVQALKKEDITIFGDGTQTRSFCYVDDQIEGMIRTMEKGPEFTGPVNIGNPDEFTILKLAEKVMSRCASPSKIIHMPLPTDDPQQRRPDINYAKEEVSWVPQVSLVEGLKKTVPYFQDVLRMNGMITWPVLISSPNKRGNHPRHHQTDLVDGRRPPSSLVAIDQPNRG